MSNLVCRKKWSLEEQSLEGLNMREVLERVKAFATLETELARISEHE
jgi:hypothetical protein